MGSRDLAKRKFKMSPEQGLPPKDPQMIHSTMKLVVRISFFLRNRSQ